MRPAPSSRRSEAGAPGVADGLLRWFKTHRRPLPWRVSRDPYRIWVAEVLLQQTRVDQAAPYFERFVRRFPTVVALAAARTEEVLKVWEGAGYYRRARDLREAARQVVRRYRGKVPGRVEELLTLPGVGPYTARAIASIAFGAPYVALEANGIRVASRLYRDTGRIDTAQTRARLTRRLEALLPEGRAGEFNEALMELGETVCRPRAPACPSCPLAPRCRAFRETDDPATLPRRGPRPARPHIRASVVVVENRGRWLLQRRPSGGMLGGLWEFPGGKIEAGEEPMEAARRELREETGLSARRLTPLGVVQHGYSHFTVELHVFRYRHDGPWRATATRRWVAPPALAALPLPGATRKIVDELRSTEAKAWTRG